MATSDDASGPAEWAQLGGWPHLLPPPSPLAAPSGCVSDSIGVAAHQPGVGGRVSKPVRRRSRASRRTPTTMLNTDTANFRSMVQQFTGIPSGPYSSAYRPGGGPISNLGYNFNEPIHQTTSMTRAAPAAATAVPAAAEPPVTAANLSGFSAYCNRRQQYQQ
ncbi:VQ motif [Musa troglodytarum]|uniref:VQ motif n=1 Tax=Musa troglodytarum TaxID=320322 RepID=A0A9E7KRS8_9LILI|nr:VQ motif [Musa troglodytarum]